MSGQIIAPAGSALAKELDSNTGAFSADGYSFGSDAAGPLAAGTTTAPQFSVTANGIPIPYPVSAQVDVFNNFRAGTFSLLVAFNDNDQMNLAWWASQSSIRIIISAHFDAGPPVQLIVGDVDDQPFGALGENTVTLTGRDLSAKLMDTKTSDLYANQTSSEIITILAGLAGLTPVVTKTNTVVGQYYAYDHVHIALGGFSRAITQWDLATYLAQNENFDLFVQGSSLYFQPKASPSGPFYPLKYQRTNGYPSSNVISIQPSRSLTIAKGTVITVKSWNSASRRAVVETAGTAGNDGQTYVVYQPNLTPAQAIQLAQQRLAEITKFEKKLDVVMPGDLSLTPRLIMQLTGTNSAFDQLYYPDDISRSIDFDGGFAQHVTALNHAPVNEPSDIATSGATAAPTSGATDGGYYDGPDPTGADASGL